jgi:adenylyl- and sulfurtransferase ThiI
MFSSQTSLFLFHCNKSTKLKFILNSISSFKIKISWYQKERQQMTTPTLQDRITAWIKDYAEQANIKSLVVGISGGIDSAVVSALCARTGLNTVAVTMPIRQRPDLHDLSIRQGAWLAERFDNVRHEIIDLTPVFDEFENRLSTYPNLLGLANSRSRLRMVTLYQIAQTVGGLVVGTGNKVEDFGVGVLENLLHQRPRVVYGRHSFRVDDAEAATTHRVDLAVVA